MLVARHRLGEADEIAAEFEKEHGPGRKFIYAHLTWALSILAGAVLGYLFWPMMEKLHGISVFSAKILGPFLGAVLARIYVGMRLSQHGLITLNPARDRIRLEVLFILTAL